jgi:hypothetical protein
LSRRFGNVSSVLHSGLLRFQHNSSNPLATIGARVHSGVADSMAKRTQDASLLDTLRDLYRQLANRMLEARWKGYHPERSGAGSAELASRLHDYITQVPPPAPRRAAGARFEPHRAPRHTPTPNPDAAPGEKPSKRAPGLEEMHYNHPVHQSVGEQLMHSASEHLHASIRAARIGNPATARLHAGIMESSLREAAQFVDDERYRDFVQTLGAELDKQTQLMRGHEQQRGPSPGSG